MTIPAMVPAGRPWDGTGPGVGDEEEVVGAVEALVAIEVEDEDGWAEVELDVVEAETVGRPAVEPVVTRL